MTPRTPAHLRLDTGGDDDAHPLDALAPGSPADPGDDRDWAALAPRDISPERWHEFETYMARIFEAMGMPMDTEATARTPTRFLRPKSVYRVESIESAAAMRA